MYWHRLGSKKARRRLYAEKHAAGAAKGNCQEQNRPSWQPAVTSLATESSAARVLGYPVAVLLSIRWEV
jgi:hypothetical protein